MNHKKNESVSRQEAAPLCLSDIKPGQWARIKELTVTGSIRRRLLDIGLVEDTPVECLGKSPSGDPLAYRIRGAVIAIRSEDCQGILIYSNV